MISFCFKEYVFVVIGFREFIGCSHEVPLSLSYIKNFVLDGMKRLREKVKLLETAHWSLTHQPCIYIYFLVVARGADPVNQALFPREKSAV